MSLCILIPLLVGLLSAILGYLIGRLSSGGTTDSGDIELWRNKNAQLESDLAKCKAKLVSGAGAVSSMAATAVSYNAGAAKSAFGKNIKKDDLTVVEGIGPKIRDLFKNHGISTWKSLSEASVERCQEILKVGGERYTVHNPGTWPRQAKLAFEGKWEELKEWQGKLDKGKE